jgi:DNA repair protein RecO (recombination protein O)
MSETTVTAIVIRRKDSGESDRRLTLLTRELGKVDAIAKGAKKAASRLAGSSDPLTVARMTLAKGKVNQFVTQAQPIRSFRGIRTDYERLSLALALVELYAAVMPWAEPLESSYDLLDMSLNAIDTHPEPVVALVWAELKLLEESGFLPPFDHCIVSGSRVKERNPWLSPVAGGFVSAEKASDFPDRFQTTFEVLIGLARTAELPEPPRKLRFAEECLMALVPFWRHVLDAPLPANEALKKELRHAHIGNGGDANGLG